jgi:hypothetical protein
MKFHCPAKGKKSFSPRSSPTQGTATPAVTSSPDRMLLISSQTYLIRRRRPRGTVDSSCLSLATLFMLGLVDRESVKSPPRLLVTAKSSLLYVDVIPFPHLLLAALPLHLRTTYSFVELTMKSQREYGKHSLQGRSQDTRKHIPSRKQLIELHLPLCPLESLEG